MKTEKIMKILNCLSKYAVFGSGGVGLRLSSISEWTGIPRSTTYRYLKKLEKINMVSAHQSKFRNEDCNFWYVTSEGEKYVTPSF